MAEGKPSYFEMPGEHIVDGIYLSKHIRQDVVNKIKHDFTFKDEDILVATYCKSGTTWMQSILYLLHNPNDIRERKLSKNPLQAITYMEVDDNLDMVKDLAPPRLIKSHLPFPFLKRALSGGKTKIVVVMRNPKDTLVSFYHFYRANSNLGNFPGSWGEFFQMFLADRLVFGNWFDYTLTWWEQRNRGNIIFIKFEDMKENLEREIQKVAKFIGKEVSADDVKIIAKMTSFGQMKELIDPHISQIPMFDEHVSPFMRKGQVGDWKNHFTVAQNKVFDRIYAEKMRDTGLEFNFGH